MNEATLKLLDKYIWDLLVVTFSIILLWRGISVVGSQIQAKGIGPMTMQALGLVVLLPAILMLSTNNSVPGELTATLIGAIAGYIFGVRNAETS